MKELLIRTGTGISIVVLVVAAILSGPLPFLGLMVVVYTLGTLELGRLYPPNGSIRNHMWAFLSAGLILPVAYMVLQHQWSPLLFLIPAGGWMAASILTRGFTVDLLLLLWLAIPLSSFFTLGYLTEQGSYRPVLPLAVIILVWTNDTFAYLSGSLLGRHPMTPKLSPGKTWEGFTGGVLATLLGGYLIVRITGEFTLAWWITISLLTSSMCLAGDLFESGLKRKREIKDTGAILPGHGGILDRFDSLLFAAPAILLLIILMNNRP